MTTKLLLISGLLSACLLGCAWQKPTPTAARLYEDGGRLIDDRSYDTALEMLEHSMRLEPTCLTAARLVQVNERLERDAAADYWRRVVILHGGLAGATCPERRRITESGR